jgi:hypothetical protein
MTEPTDRIPFPAPNAPVSGQPVAAGPPQWAEPATPAPKRNRGMLTAIIAGGTAFVAVTAVVVLMAVRGSGKTGTADPSPVYAPIPTVSEYSWKSTTPTYTTTTSTSETPTSVSTSSSPPVATQAFRRASGPAGISVEIPADWPVKPGAVSSNVQADSTEVAGDLLRFGGSTSTPNSLQASIVEYEANTPSIRLDYQRLQLGPAGDGSNAVVWEFLFTTKDGAARHAIGRYWRLGRIDYVVYMSSSVDSWASMAPIYGHMVQTATPV